MACRVPGGIFETQHLEALNPTSFLHEDEEFIKKLLSLWVVIQFVKLQIEEQYHQHAVYSVLYLGLLMKGGKKFLEGNCGTPLLLGGLMSSNYFLILLMFKMLP